jgi:hypothetical protein
MDNTYYIYFHINPVKQEVFYVGMGKQQRPYETTSRNKWWHKTVNKYDYQIIIIHRNLSLKEAQSLEIKYIAQLGRKKFKEGTLVNITLGGTGGATNLGNHHTEETKVKISKANKGRHLGKKLTSQHKIKIGLSQKGKSKHSNETKLKISEKLKGRLKSREHKKKISLSTKGIKRKPCSEETKLKISKKNKGRKPLPLSIESKEKIKFATQKTVLQLDSLGNILYEWPSLKIAGETLGIFSGSISEACSNYKGRQFAGGFKWKLLKNNEN